MIKHPKSIIYFFIVLFIISIALIPRLKVNYDFNQFFPQGDPDLIFYQSFIKDFENDDNFLIIAVENKNGDIFEKQFLNTINELTLSLKDTPHIKSTQSITSIRYPLKTPFGYTLLPLVHIDNDTLLQEDKTNLLNDERLANYLISEDKKSTAIVIKTENEIDVVKSNLIMDFVKNTMARYKLSDDQYHILGRAAFQSDLVNLQIKEVFISSFVSAILVTIILTIIFARFWTVFIALIGILTSLVLFLGFLGLIGRELNILAALYPVLILIVGCSDVVHIMTKYIDELDDDMDKVELTKRVLKEIGMATFLTAITSAVGFISLNTSRLQAIREFGLNAGIGIIIAFFTVATLVPAILMFFRKDQLVNPKGRSTNLLKFAMSAYEASKNRPRQILAIFGIGTLICLAGTFMINTNYKILNSLPRDQKLTKDFVYFEKQYAGFRPLELAITIDNGLKADDYKVVKEINKIENHLKSTGVIKGIFSQVGLYKNLNMVHHNNNPAFYVFPDSISDFENYKKLIQKSKLLETSVLINKDKSKTRLSSKIADIGADSIKKISIKTDEWINKNIDTSIMQVRQTGTGVIMDKNSIYVTENLIYGLLSSILITALIIAFLLRSFKMIVIFTITNVMPLLFGGAVMGFFGIDLEAGVSVIFAIIFGVAVDDSIHFLSRYQQILRKGYSVEDAIKETYKDTGKAIVLTSIILFFGFLVMLFSKHPHSNYIGILISFTLLSAVLCDLYLLPVLLRLAYKKNLDQ